MNTPINIRQIAGSVAAAMAYTLKAASPTHHEGYAVIEGPDGAALSFNTAHVRPLGTTGGRIHISAVFPDQIDGRQAWRPQSGIAYPSINVSAEKAPDAIAREISRRLMPDYLPMLAECREHIAKWTAVAEETAETAGKLAAGVGGTVDSRDSSYATVRVPGVYIKVGVTGSRVRFDGFSVGPKVAAQILALIVASERSTD